MCAIFGLGFLKGHKINSNNMARNLVRTMFLENEVCGRTASGIAYVSADNIKVVKTNVKATEFIDLPEYDSTETTCMDVSTVSKDRLKNGLVNSPPISIIGHCRLKTKGTELDNKNNHPIVRDSVVGVHNGCVHNDDVLFERYSESFSRNGEVDSEIIFALIEHFVRKGYSIHESIQEMSLVTSGSFACAMAHRMHPHVVWIFRRRNPCTVILFKDVGLLMWSTSETFIKNAIKPWPIFGKGEDIELNVDSGLGIDLYRNKIHNFSIDQYYYHNVSAER